MDQAFVTFDSQALFLVVSMVEFCFSAIRTLRTGLDIYIHCFSFAGLNLMVRLLLCPALLRVTCSSSSLGLLLVYQMDPFLPLYLVYLEQ